MKIVHRISGNLNSRPIDDINHLGVDISVAGDFYFFDVDEPSSEWSALQTWLQRVRPVDIPMNVFEDDEVDGAAFVEVVPDWHHQYPEPKNGFGFREVTYDVSDYCRKCGIGAVQRAPFRMAGEPSWRSSAILQLNWIFDEYFVTPALWESVFKSAGVEQIEVHNSKGNRLKTVVQLKVQESCDVDTGGLPSQTCPVCGRVKYYPVTPGMLPSLTKKPTCSLARTESWFGDGASGFRRVIVPQKIVQALKAQNVVGVTYRPVT